MMSSIKIIAEEDFPKIHEESLKILSETGVAMHHHDALAICKKHGANVDAKIVRFPKKMVEDALASSPETFTFRGRNQNNSITVGKGITIGPSGGCVFVQELNGERRRGRLEDVANFQKLYQSSEVVDITGAGPIDPSDVPAGEMHLAVTYEILKNTDKPFFGFCNMRNDDAVRIFDMVEIAFGEKEVTENNHVMGYSSCISSPLSFHYDVLAGHIEYARRNQPVALTCCSLPGASTPITILDMAVQQNAEILAGITFTQIINPGTPVLYSPVSPYTNFRRVTADWGCPQAMLYNIANIQMASDFYHLPSRVITGVTNGKIVDVQAGYETMQSLLLSALAGANVNYQFLGILDGTMTLSYEKHIIDEEIISRVKTIVEGLANPSGAVSSETIQAIGPGGSYLDHASTFELFRSQWQPTVSESEAYEDWEKRGEDITVRAHKMVNKRIDAAPANLLDPDVDKALRSYINKASKSR